MTDKQIIIDCSYKGECQMMGCINDDTCFIKQLFEERDRAEKELYSKEQECEKAKQNAQDTYDLWQALIESFNILQGEKIKLEQECEELKKANDKKNELLIKLGCPTTATAKRKVFCLQEQIDQLKAKLEDFQDDCEGCSTCDEVLYNAHLYAKECSQLKETIEDLLSIQYKLADSNLKLRQTLAEIKEIAEEVYNDEQIKFQASGVCYEILQKINEVENEN